MPVALPRPRAIIFDWDNTLVDTWSIIHDALNVTFNQVGLRPWTLEETRMKVRKSMRDSFPELFGEKWQEAGTIFQDHYKSTHLDKLSPLPEAEPVLQRVRELGLFSVVVSNKKGETLRKEVAQLGWGGYFDAVVGSHDAAHDKPHPAPVALAFEESNLAPGPEVWFIGDSEIDLECAQNTGCTAILYGELVKDHPQFTATHYIGFPYQLHVNNHQEMLELLATI